MLTIRSGLTDVSVFSAHTAPETPKPMTKSGTHTKACLILFILCSPPGADLVAATAAAGGMVHAAGLGSLAIEKIQLEKF
jgi:hypothetical protein